MADEVELKGVVGRVGDVFTEEALQGSDGQTVPLRSSPGGPIIGEATLKYDPDAKVLEASMTVDDPKLAEFLRGPMPNIFEQ